MKRDVNYSRLRRLYPDTVPFDELCVLLHFSKRKVKWMLDHDWIKHETYERKTWKYRIPTEAVIDYLLLSENRSDLFTFPENCFSSRTPYTSVGSPRVVFKDPEEIASMLRLLWRQLPDIVSMRQIVEFTGYSKDRVQRIMEKNHVDVLILKQAIHFNKEAAIAALSHPTSQRPCDYTAEMQAIIFKLNPSTEKAANE